MKLKNYMEEVVFSSMDEVLKGMDMCKCDRCKLDIAAKALNDLPPKYVVTEKGEIYSKVDTLKAQFGVDVTSAIMRAAMIVKRNPHHDMEDDDENNGDIEKHA